MNTRPETTVGCALLVIPFGRPKAHFSLSRGTSAAVSRAAAAGWKRVLARSLPQPFHAGPLAGSRIAGLLVHWFGIAFASPASTLPSGRPHMNSPTRCFWMSLSVCPSGCAGSISAASMRSGVICRIASAVVLALVARCRDSRSTVSGRWPSRSRCRESRHVPRGGAGGRLVPAGPPGAPVAPRRPETTFQRRGRRRRQRSRSVRCRKVCSDANLYENCARRARPRVHPTPVGP